MVQGQRLKLKFNAGDGTSGPRLGGRGDKSKRGVSAVGL